MVLIEQDTTQWSGLLTQLQSGQTGLEDALDVVMEEQLSQTSLLQDIKGLLQDIKVLLTP